MAMAQAKQCWLWFSDLVQQAFESLTSNWK